MFLIVCLVRTWAADRTSLLAEILALRQQLAALHRTAPRPQLRSWERGFWVVLSRWFTDWRSWLIIVKPDTVVRWHRQGFRLYWRWKSRGVAGRPTVSRGV